MSCAMAMQSRGILELMEAEKEADKLVKDARKKKAARLKQAVEEARWDIDTYKKDRDKTFQEQQAKYAGSKDNFAAKIEKDTEEKLEQLSVDVDTHKEEVLKRLMELVFDIKLDIHQNLRLKEELDKR